MSLATVLAALSLTAATPASSADVILPGVMDLPVTIGVKDGAACKRFLSELKAEGPAFDCVDTTGLDANQAWWDYINAGVRAGWKPEGGAAIAFWLDRPRREGGCELVDVLAMADFSLPGGQVMNGPTAILFGYQPSGACRDYGE